MNAIIDETLPYFEAFCCKLKNLWHATTILSTQNDIWCAQSDAFNIKVFNLDHNTPLTIKHIKHIAINENDTLLLFLFQNQTLDACIRSPITHDLVIARNINPRSNPYFWQLGSAKSLLAASILLELFFGKQKLQKQFVTKFKLCLKQLANAWENLSTNTPETAQQLAFDTLLRLLFLAFLQTRGILDGRTDFILQEAYKSLKNQKNIYQDFIKPFFFGTLNVPPHKRAKRAKSFGNIPFLNGGLFHPTKEEIANPNRSVNNDTFYRICSTLLEKWSFTDHESNNNNALDPMMLGHVFEMLMPKDMRYQTGSFYTPMNLVRDIVSRAFINWICFNASLSLEHAQRLVKHHHADHLTENDATNLFAKLQNIRIIDIASGSGAFLQEAASNLHQIMTTLQIRLNLPTRPSELARQILLNNIFGVDILENATRICELRLWLSTLQYYNPNEPIPPLPNLDINIRCGNSLIDLTQYALTFGIDTNTLPTQLQKSAKNLRRKYGTASGKAKQTYARKIELLDKSIENELFNHVQNAIQTQINTIRSQYPDKNLFGETNIPPLNIRNDLKLLTKHAHDLNAKRLQGSFSFDVHFTNIMTKGGFDIILGNPPWFPLHTRNEDEQKTLRRLYQTAEKINQAEKTNQAIDISALFVEKSLRICKSGGIVAMLLPNKLFNAPSYARFRNYIQVHTLLVSTKDWSEASPFDATVYPADLILQKIDQRPRNREAWLSHADACKLDIDKPTPVSRALDACKADLSTCFTLKRGLRTSANDIFIGSITNTDPITQITNIRFKNNIETAIESQQLYPILRGADIRPFIATPKQHLVLTHQAENLAKPVLRLPPLTQQWMERNKDALASRPQLGNAPYYAIFGASPHLRAPKVVWRDIDKTLSAAYVPNINILPINTVYYIPVPNDEIGYLLAAFLNADPIRNHCAQHAEYASNGYKRFFAWLIGKIPWPFQHPISLDKNQQKLIELSKQAHLLATSTGIDHTLQEQINHCVLHAIHQVNA